MNKQEVAEMLGVSVRAVERYTTAGRLSVRYERGRTRSVAAYDEREVRALKSELENPPEVRPTVVTATPTNPEQARPTPTEAFVLRGTEALGRAADGQGMTMFASLLADALRAVQTPGNGHGGDVSLADLAHKMSLSFTEAARLSGVPEGQLREAVRAGELAGAKIGRGVRVTPYAVREYVERRIAGKQGKKR